MKISRVFPITVVLLSALLLLISLAGCTPQADARQDNKVQTSETAQEETPSVSIEDTASPSMGAAISELPNETVETPSPLPEIQGSGEIAYSNGVTPLTPEQEALLQAYMDTAYESLARLEEPDFTALFSDETQAQASQSGIVMQIEIRQFIDGVDYSLTGYYYSLDCQSVRTSEDGSIAVGAIESSVQNFTQTPGIDSEQSGTFHHFVLEELDGNWYIREHMRYDTLYGQLMQQGGNQGGWGSLAQQYIDAVPAYLEEMRSAHAERTAQWGLTEALPAAEQPYDREAALAYADQYALTRSSEWVDYSRSGGNCQNYVSQCLLAGGIPMDPYGGAVWKWYDGNLSETPGASGRSRSWAGVQSFVAYVRNNTGYGLVAQVDAPYYSGQSGDLLEMGTKDALRHTVIIRDLVLDADGLTVDYLVNSNTTDMRNYPASLYGYSQFVLTRIAGWNT